MQDDSWCLPVVCPCLFKPCGNKADRLYNTDPSHTSYLEHAFDLRALESLMSLLAKQQPLTHLRSTVTGLTLNQLYDVTVLLKPTSIIIRVVLYLYEWLLIASTHQDLWLWQKEVESME